MVGPGNCKNLKELGGERNYTFVNFKNYKISETGYDYKEMAMDTMKNIP